MEAEKRMMDNGLSIQDAENGKVALSLSGRWRVGAVLPRPEEVIAKVAAVSGLHTVSFNAEGLTDWDSKLLTFLIAIERWCESQQVTLQIDDLPDGVKRLLRLASAVPEREGAKKTMVKEDFFSRTGQGAINLWSALGESFGFLGDATGAFARLVSGRASFRMADLILFIQESGFQAFGIVSLISGLVGLILAFVGAVQLQTFGAQIYVADLVGIAMVRVMGAIMTGIIMAGRTGASYAAQLGTMQVNEEIDALKTLGISPMEFLVIPRMLALMLMMPLLCVYADVMGILGGMVVGVTMLDLNPVVYLNQTKAALSLTNFWIGIFHSTVFGVIVALSGCLRGIQCGRSASAVGYATTSAVVTGIVSIIVATAIITIACNVLHI